MIFLSHIVVFLKVFFGANDMVLHNLDPVYPAEADTEILGVGAVTAFTVITPMILLAYVLEGKMNFKQILIILYECLPSIRGYL